MKRLSALILAVSIALMPMLSPVAVHALDINRFVCLGVTLGDSERCGEQVDGEAENTITSLAQDIIDVLSLIVGIVSVIMIIIGGLRYITSGGDSQNVTNAKNTILYAIVGLVIVLFAQTIVRFVVGRFAQ